MSEMALCPRCGFVCNCRFHETGKPLKIWQPPEAIADAERAGYLRGLREARELASLRGDLTAWDELTGLITKAETQGGE